LREETRANGERLARIETHMYSLVGNGQLGRIAPLERAIEELKRWPGGWLVVAGGSGVISVVAWLAEVQTKR
jgi:hypothetical protein